MKKKLVEQTAAILIAAVIFAAATAPFAYAETPETPVVLEMQESYAELPPYYNGMEERYVTCLKQQAMGNCWAFSTITSIETNLLKQGIVPDRAALDLSEDQLTDAMFTRSDDPLHNTAGDLNLIKDVDFGSELPWAAQLLASGLGPTDEQDYLDRGTGHQFDSDLSKADFWSCAFVPTTEQDLKRAIYQYGSVSIAVHSISHAIALIGWDDTCVGAGNPSSWWSDDSYLGAFLCKDSLAGVYEGLYQVNDWLPYDRTELLWEGEDVPDFWDGNQWPELYDAVAYEYRDKDTYDNVYLYDGSGFSGEVEAQKAAAVFEAKAGTDTQAEQIVSATLPLASLDTTASVQIYTDLRDPSDPESGTPLFEPGSEPAIHADYSGMYSVDFREFGKTAALRQGTLFSVVMTLPKGGSVMTACDGAYFSCYNKENIEPGQTFFYGYESKDGWTDGLELSHTARLHVQTKMIPISELPPPHVHSYGENWENDDTTHWKECACGDKADQATHAKTWDSDTARHWAKCDICGWVNAAKADHVYDNDRDTTCNMCGYERTATPSTSNPSAPDSDEPDAPDEPVITVEQFADVKPDAWYYGAVKYAVDNGLFYGTSDTTFSPNGNMTRGMLATVLYRLAKEPATTVEDLFDDVADGRYYSEAIAWAAGNEIVAGYGNNRFGPEDFITREQLAAILWRYAGSPESAGSLAEFTDGGKTAKYAVPALRWAVEQKIVSGRGNGILDPTGKATRAEVAAMLLRYREAL